MLIFGLTVALIGMGTVFVVLMALVGFINLMGWATTCLTKEAKTPKGAAAVGMTAVPAPVPVAAPRAVPTTIAAVDDEEIHAVLAAAVAAYTRKT